jgi:flagellar biosynthetic protein FlhB
MPQSDPRRTEEATPKRREKAREEGNVAKSEEVSKVAVVLVGIFVLRFGIEFFGSSIRDVFHWTLGQGFDFQLTNNNIYALFVYCLKKMALVMLPIMFFLVLASFFSVRLQVGPLLTTKVFVPKLGEKFNIVKGLQNIFFSMKTVVNLFKNLMQMAVVALAAYLVIMNTIPQLPGLFHQNVASIMGFTLQAGFEMVLYTILPMLLIAVIHVYYTRWDYEENLKMTKEEVRDEQKQSYGNPEVKKEQRKRVQSVMQQRMMSDVPKADVVVTNPEHLAVALRYDPKEAPAPMVLAKGADRLAQKIKEKARENQIPVQENKPLAQALYASVDVGDVIPEELYQAVASVLAQLYKFRNTPPG